jgi:hypothetical protein
MSTITDRFGPRPDVSFELTPSKDEIAFFRENGFYSLDRITTDEEILWLRKVFEYIFSDEYAGKPGSPLDRSGSDDLKLDLPKASLSQAFFPEMFFPELLGTQFRRNAKRYSAAFLEEPESEITSWGHMIQKKPGARAASWHQDHAYWQPEFDYKALGVWLPMHDVSVEMGAMQFIPGTHKRGLVPHRQEDAPEHNVLTVVNPPDPATIVPCPLKMGGCTFHHAETWHYTAPNTTDQVRMAWPMEFQIAPTRRAVPEVMPWVDEHRAVVGKAVNATYVGDGKLINI